MLRLGKLVRFLLRHGCTLDDVAGDLAVGQRVCNLALAFATAPDWLKFRALMEDWNLLAIRTELRGRRALDIPLASCDTVSPSQVAPERNAVIR